MARPRTVSLSPEEMIELGQEMVDFVIADVNNILHLSEWYTIEKGFTYKEWETLKERIEFVPYYEKAMRLIGKKYLDKTSSVREGISQRWQRIYFKDLKREEDETAKYNAELSKNDQVQYSEKDSKKLDDLLGAFKESQSRKKPLKSNKSDIKS